MLASTALIEIAVIISCVLCHTKYVYYFEDISLHCITVYEIFMVTKFYMFAMFSYHTYNTFKEGYSKRIPLHHSLHLHKEAFYLLL